VRRLIRKLAFAALGAGVLALNVDALLTQAINPAAPAVGPAPIREARLEEQAGLRRLGPCWWAEHRGQHVLYAEGDPYTLGFCASALADTDGVLDRQELALTAALDTFVPLRPVQFLLIRTLAVVYRRLPSRLFEAERQEVRGISEGREDHFEFLGPTYGRVLYYHALHDISQAMIDNPILAACTAFAVTGTVTADGHTLLARNFDFEAGRVFDEDKVVAFVRPDVGLPFVSVAWGGMAGAVTGMNAAGVGVVLNAAGSDRLDTDGRPTTLVLRDILQLATSVEEAVDIVRAADVLVPDIFTVADGKTGALAVIELAPGKVAVRRGDAHVLATNHFLHPDFADDEENARRIFSGTTATRLARLSERVEGRSAPLDVAGAIAILRDRQRPGARAAGLGHRGTIDALIAAHSVVFDLTARRLWVAAAPHTLGEYVAYDLDAVMTQGSLPDLGARPADPLLAEGAYARLVEARAQVDAARRADPAEAVRLLEAALALSPDYPPALLALAEALEATGAPDAARAQYRRFLRQGPPYLEQAERAARRLRALGAEKAEHARR
jgi:isopenicillin-N N-acyltransferase-like protein